MGLDSPTAPAADAADVVQDLDSHELLRGIIRRLDLMNHHLQILTGSTLEADDMKE